MRSEHTTKTQNSRHDPDVILLLHHATLLSFLAIENPQMMQIFADLFCLFFKNPRLYCIRSKNEHLLA